MFKEYKTIREVVGPLMVVEGVEGVTYNELVEIVNTNGEIRLGKVLEINRDKAVVQLFENSQGLQISGAKARFLGHSQELAVSEDMLEAARIDGASGSQCLFRVIIPNVMPAITTCTFLTLTNGFKLFDQNLALTGGMPSIMQNGAKINTTELLALNIYSTYNISKNYHGVAQAKAVIFFLLVAVLALTQQYATSSKEVQQ
jgi:hypothetical protein